jgi:thiosulfate dehydrogenase
MARLNTAAAFIKHNMPQGQEGTLTDKEAFDVAAYVIRQPRPDFKKKHLDWPKGRKPEDARY